MLRSTRCYLSLLVLALMAVAHADEPPAATPPSPAVPPATAAATERAPQQLPDITVKEAALKQAGAVDDGRSQAGEPVIDVDRAAIEASPTIGFIGDTLNRQPGIYMDGPAGRNKETHMRGIGAEYTRVTVDGLDLPDGDETRQLQLDRISPFAVDHLTVSRNATAAMESDGLAGRVDVALREIPHRLTIDGAAGFGGRGQLEGTRKYRLALGVGDRPTSSFGYQVFLDYQRLPIFKEKSAQGYKPNGALASTESSAGGTPIDSINFMGDFAWFYDGGEFHVKPLFLSADETKPKESYKQKVGKDATYQDENEAATSYTQGLTLENRYFFGDEAQWDAELAYHTSDNDKEKHKLNYTVKPGGLQFDDEDMEQEWVDDEVFQAKTDVKLPTDSGPLPMTWQFGAMFRQHDRDHALSIFNIDGGTITDESEARYNYALTERYYAAYLQNTLALTEHLRLTPGVRLEYTTLDTESGDGTSGSRSSTDLNPSLHLQYTPTKSWEAWAAVSRTLARPEFDQLTPFEEDDGDRYHLGNADLEASHAWAYDVGAAWKNEAGSKLGVNLFYRQVSDLIEEVDTGVVKNSQPVYQVQNVGDGYVRGVELDQRLNFGWLGETWQPFTLWANQAFLDSEVELADGTRRPFQLQPEFIASVGLDVNIASTGTEIGIAAKHVGERREYGEDEHTDYDPEWTVDLNVRQRLAPHAWLRLDVVNLTDNETRTSTYSAIDGSLVENETEKDYRYFMVSLEVHF